MSRMCASKICDSLPSAIPEMWRCSSRICCLVTSRAWWKRSISEGIRLSVSESSGCSGYTYQIDYVDKKEEKDLVFTFDEVSVFIDENSFKFLKGTKVDFLVEGVNEGIKFLNPNVKAICGCGESFEVDI